MHLGDVASGRRCNIAVVIVDLALVDDVVGVVMRKRMSVVVTMAVIVTVAAIVMVLQLFNRTRTYR